MPAFSAKSLERLTVLHSDLRRVIDESIKRYDFTVLETYRGKFAQEQAFQKGCSKAHFGESAHNYDPAVAIDIAPYPVDWNNTARFKELADVVLAVAKELGVSVRWGGDWNQNGISTDEHLVDMPHFELHPWRNFVKKA